MKKMKIVLLRHVESQSNKNNKADSQIDAGLTKKGLKEAEELVPILSKYNFDIFIVSPLKRTYHTIQPFLKTIKNPLLIKNKLTLERDLGGFTGTLMGGFQRYCEKNNLDKVSYRPKNGESILDVYRRAKEFLSFLKKNYSNKTILICGHKNFLLCLEIIIRKNKIKDYYSFTPLKTGGLRDFIIS